jgi:hypothetical protein
MDEQRNLPGGKGRTEDISKRKVFVFSSYEEELEVPPGVSMKLWSTFYASIGCYDNRWGTVFLLEIVAQARLF